MMHQHLHAVAPSPAMTAAIGPLDTDAAASEPPLNGHAAQPDVEQPAEETQKPPAEDGGALSVEAPEPEFKIPKMSYFETLKLFLKFGCLAVGGPVRSRRGGALAPVARSPLAPRAPPRAGAADCDGEGGAGDQAEVDLARRVQQGTHAPTLQPCGSKHALPHATTPQCAVACELPASSTHCSADAQRPMHGVSA
jgi:hypothetical protein